MPFSSRTMAPEDWKLIRYFKPSDFNHPDKIGYEFMRWVDDVRHDLGEKIYPSSDHRTPEANAAAGGAKKSAHMEVPCDAMDFSGLKMTGQVRFKLVTTALAHGCERIGIYENGVVHLDRSEGRPSPVIWTKV